MILDVFEVRVSDEADTDNAWSLFATTWFSAFDHVVREGPESALELLIDALRVVRGHAKDLTIPDPDSRELTYLAQRLQFPSVRELSEALATRMDFASSLLGGSRSAPR